MIVWTIKDVLAVSIVGLGLAWILLCLLINGVAGLARRIRSYL